MHHYIQNDKKYMGYGCHGQIKCSSSGAGLTCMPTDTHMNRGLVPYQTWFRTKTKWYQEETIEKTKFIATNFCLELCSTTQPISLELSFLEA